MPREAFYAWWLERFGADECAAMARAIWSTGWQDVTAYTRPMAMEYEVQRFQMNDVILIDLPEQGGIVREAKVLRDIDRNDTTVRVVLQVVGQEEDFLKEWRVGERVTVVRGH